MSDASGGCDGLQSIVFIKYYHVLIRGSTISISLASNQVGGWEVVGSGPYFS